MLDDATAGRLRDALEAADFTADAVYAVLGDEAHRALTRNQVAPALRATRGGSPLETLVRLFSLQAGVPRREVDAALPGLVGGLAAGGLLAVDGDAVRAAVDVRPYGDETHDWWVVCDLTPGLDAPLAPMDPEHVLGISEASSSLAGLVVREPVGRALDLGTGCGVQGLHLAQHADRVVATDVNPRALAMADLTSRLNEVPFEVRAGSLYEPVVRERFDLIATNPPFVVSPPEGDRLVYRETGLPGDEVVRRVVTGAADHLAPGGRCQVLAAWLHTADETWDERLAGWVSGTGLDAWIVQREVLDLSAYTEMWLADMGVAPGPEHVARYDRWLSWFADQRIEAMGFGWITLRRADREVPDVRIETFAGEVVGPVATSVAEQHRAVDALATDALDVRWRRSADVVQDTHGAPGADDPEAIVLRRTEGLVRAVQVDTVEAALVGACDGDLTAGAILDAVGSLLDRPGLRADYADRVRALVADGFLIR